MCDPLTIAGMALTAGSTVANSMAANKAAKARSSVMAAERVRQGMLDKEADALNLTSRERYTDFPEKQEERAGQLADLYNAPEATPAGELLPATTSNITVQETEKQKAKAKEYTTKQGKALGTLRSFGDYLGDVSRSQAREAGLVGQIGGFKQGSGGIVPFELESANQAGNKYKFFGDLLNTGGQLAMGFGMQGGYGEVGGGAAPTLGLGGGTDPWSSLRKVTTAPRSKDLPPRSLAGIGSPFG